MASNHSDELQHLQLDVIHNFQNNCDQNIEEHQIQDLTMLSVFEIQFMEQFFHQLFEDHMKMLLLMDYVLHILIVPILSSF